MERFEKILIKYGCPKRLERALSSVDEIELFAKFKLPTDYKIYLQHYLSFEEYIGDQYVSLWNQDEILELNINYGIPEKLLNTLGIGSNVSTEFIAIEKLSSGEYRIILTSQNAVNDLEKESKIEVGTSFTDFLIQLENGKTWLKEGPSNTLGKYWPKTKINNS